MVAPGYLGEIRLMTWGFGPANWRLCNGQTMSISQNLALFSLIGTTYGGNGSTTFLLPDLRGHVPMHVGRGHVIGESAGTESVTLNLHEMPAHLHFAGVVNANANVGPAGHFLAASNAAYAPPPGNTTLAPNTISMTGGNLPHENRQPYLGISFAICVQGVFPSRN